ncbi:hypothetical protein SAMN02787142_3711 [Burkholderia sp. WP9]|nr:hypothetical protein SAMN02787142_3711 [Burkholderia sp. WP9]
MSSERNNELERNMAKYNISSDVIPRNGERLLRRHFLDDGFWRDYRRMDTTNGGGRDAGGLTGSDQCRERRPVSAVKFASATSLSRARRLAFQKWGSKYCSTVDETIAASAEAAVFCAHSFRARHHRPQQPKWAALSRCNPLIAERPSASQPVRHRAIYCLHFTLGPVTPIRDTRASARSCSAQTAARRKSLGDWLTVASPRTALAPPPQPAGADATR